MNKFIEASGKTVKDAIQNGLKMLGCTQDDVETSVIDMGSPGLFGMFGKPAKVRLTMKEKDTSFDIEMPVFTLDQPAQTNARKKTEKKTEKKPQTPKAEKPAPTAAEETEIAEAPAQEEAAPASEKKSRRSRQRKNKENREPRPEPVTEAAPAEPAEPFVATEEEALSEPAKRARDFLKGITDRMGVPTEIEVSGSNNI